MFVEIGVLRRVLRVRSRAQSRDHGNSLKTRSIHHWDSPLDDRFGSRAAMLSTLLPRRVHPRKRPYWRRAVTSALGQ